MSYDHRSDKVVLFGGYTTTYNVETWEYDLESGSLGTWTQRTPATAPTARTGPGAEWDREGDRVVMFGGSGSNETWLYDILANTSVYPTPYSKLITLAAGLYNVTIKSQSGAGVAKINITLDNSTLDERNVSSSSEVVTRLRISIGAGNHWLQVKGNNMSDVHLVEFTKLVTNATMKDTEGDGLNDDEPYVHGTLPTSKDTDRDGLWDGREVAGQNITVNGQTTRGESSPVLADTDSDGLGDLAEWGTQLNESFQTNASSWTKFGSSGTWSWGKDGSNGIYKFTGTGVTNSNAWTEVLQGGATTYEWRAKITGTNTNSARGFGLVFFASDGPATDRGTNYYVWQEPSALSIWKCTTSTGSGTSSCSVGASAPWTYWNGNYYRYKATYNPANSTVSLWRNNSFVMSWTDSSPLMTGAFVSLRTNVADVMFDHVYANRTASNPKSNDTDADGLYDWNDLSGWNPVNGTWEWRDGVYHQTLASSGPLTNSYAVVAQSGEMTYEWKMRFPATGSPAEERGRIRT
jgi:hypothetical protein